MKISIRVKFFVVLLAFSLGPIFISRTLVGKAVHKIGTTLSLDTRAELLEIVSTELQHSAMALLDNLETRAKAMAIGVHLLAREAEHALDHPVSDNMPATIAKDGRGLTPPDAKAFGGYVKLTKQGAAKQIEVSLTHPAFRAPGGIVNDTAKQQAHHLIQMLPTLKFIYNELGDTSAWLNIGLESGIHLNYPGHGGFPRMYDHRKQEWYTQAKRINSGTHWVSPVADPSTRRAVATVSYPIHGNGGAFLGTASIDVPNSSILYDSELKSRWQGDIRSFMVIRRVNAETLDDGLLILAQRSYNQGGQRYWKQDIEAEWLDSDDDAALQKLLDAMAGAKSGHMRLPHNGREAVWAWASNDNFTFMLIAPETVVAKLPNAMSNSLNTMFENMRSISGIISGIMLLFTGLIAWFGSRAITRPLLAMVQKVKRMAGGDFTTRMDYKTGDERDALINAFNEMGPQLQERMLLRRDMELAQEVQNLLLPRTSPELPGFDISGGIVFCDQTGGDYYDFIKVQNENDQALSVVLGDVSGHGVPSALVMATARGQLHALAKAPLRPEQRIQAINTVLSRDLDGTGRFLTLFYLRLMANSNEVCWVRAGHDPAIRYNPATDAFGELGGDGLALGVLDGFDYQRYSTTLAPGEVLVMATDGVWEARNSQGEMFGKKRMLAIIAENAHKRAKDIKNAIMDAVESYQANGQEDDIAVVVVKKD